MSSLVRGEHLVEVGNIKHVLAQRWLVRRSDLSLHQSIDVNISKPWVTNDLIKTCLGPKSLSWLLLQTELDEVLTVV